MNWSTVIVAAMVAAVFIAIVVSEVRKRKSGKGGCGCGCSGCAMSDSCHSKSENQT